MHVQNRQPANYILRGVGREIHPVPDDDFLQAMKSLPRRLEERLTFMSREHHQIRDFVVREMPRESRPLSPQKIGQVTALDQARVVAILADLEKHLFFVVRDADGNVTWAFPVTTCRTAHHLTFSTGEKTFGA
jgi:CRP-like cAMP-binding protein